MRKKLLIIIGIVVVIILSFSIWMIITMNNYSKEIKTLKINNVNLSTVKDGTYSGYYKIFPILVRLRVTVLNHQITDIKIVEHQNGQGKPAEAIVDSVIEAQSLEVDTISGATSSSKVILKAIEEALNKK